MKFKQYEILQKPNQPPRKHFTDTQHFDLIIWYKDQGFNEPAGFQLGYKENPFNTDDEVFVILKPKEHQLLFKSTLNENKSYPTPKLLNNASKNIADNLMKKLSQKIIDLPIEVRKYLEINLYKKMKNINKQK